MLKTAMVCGLLVLATPAFAQNRCAESYNHVTQTWQQFGAGSKEYREALRRYDHCSEDRDSDDNIGRHERQGAPGTCRELRAACVHKDELGEQGTGNCRRYREECQD